MDDTDTATVYSMNVSRVSISILTLHDIIVCKIYEEMRTVM